MQRDDEPAAKSAPCIVGNNRVTVRLYRYKCRSSFWPSANRPNANLAAGTLLAGVDGGWIAIVGRLPSIESASRHAGASAQDAHIDLRPHPAPGKAAKALDMVGRYRNRDPREGP
jgi:hypothetical protein